MYGCMYVCIQTVTKINNWHVNKLWPITARRQSEKSPKNRDYGFLVARLDKSWATRYVRRATLTSNKVGRQSCLTLLGLRVSRFCFNTLVFDLNNTVLKSSSWPRSSSWNKNNASCRKRIAHLSEGDGETTTCPSGGRPFVYQAW